jgi:hypothetical protein
MGEYAEVMMVKIRGVDGVIGSKGNQEFKAALQETTL